MYFDFLLEIHYIAQQWAICKNMEKQGTLQMFCSLITRLYFQDYLLYLYNESVGFHSIPNIFEPWIFMKFFHSIIAVM